MWLEYAYDTFARIKEPDRFNCRSNLFGMMCIVINIHQVFLPYPIIKAPLHTGKAFQTATELILVKTTGEGHCRCRNSVLHIEQGSAIKLKVVHHTVRGAHIKEYVAIIRPYIYCIIIGLHTVRCIGAIWPVNKIVLTMVMIIMIIVVFMVPKHFAISCGKDTMFEEQTPINIYLVRKLGICFKHCFMCAIHIQMVGVSGRNNSIVWMQLQK